MDQLFSRIGDEIRKTGCESLPGDHQCPNFTCIHITLHKLDLLDVVHRSSTPNPLCSLVETVWNVKEWLEPYLEPLEGHSKWAVFRFTRNSEGHSELHYKQSSDKPWEPQKDGAILALD